MTDLSICSDTDDRPATTVKRRFDRALSWILRDAIVAHCQRYGAIRRVLGIGLLAAFGSMSNPAMACSDLANICQMNQQHHQNMMDYGRQAAEAQAGWSWDQYDEPESPRAPPPPPRLPTFMAIATHIDTSAVWISRGHWDQAPAEKRVVDACNAAMGGGCTVAAAMDSYSKIVLVYDAMGMPYVQGVPTISSDISGRATKDVVLKLCNASSFGCYQSYVFPGTFLPPEYNHNSDYSKDIFPNFRVQRHHWVMVAQPENAAPASQGKSWIVSGKQNADAVRKEVLDRCRTDSKSPCKISAFAANGMLAHYVDAKGQSRWISASGDRMLEQRVYRACRGDQKPCRVVAQYDAITPRVQVVDDAG